MSSSNLALNNPGRFSLNSRLNWKLASVIDAKFDDAIKVFTLAFENKPSVVSTVEPRYNQPLYNEVLGITNGFLYPGPEVVKQVKKNRYNETSL